MCNRWAFARAVRLIIQPRPGVFLKHQILLVGSGGGAGGMTEWSLIAVTPFFFIIGAILAEQRKVLLVALTIICLCSRPALTPTPPASICLSSQRACVCICVRVCAR